MILHALLHLPLVIHQALDNLDQLFVHQLLILKEPGSFLRDGHIAGDSDTMVQRALIEEHLVTTVGLERLILQLLIVHELRFINQDMIERHTIRSTLTVLSDDLAHRTVVERDDVLPVLGREDGILPVQGLPGLLSDGIVHIALETPSLPMYQERGQSGYQTFLIGRGNEARCTALHLLEHLDLTGRIDQALSGTTTHDSNQVTRHQHQGIELRIIEVLFLRRRHKRAG